MNKKERIKELLDALAMGRRDVTEELAELLAEVQEAKPASRAKKAAE
jgi:hypothetical protein